MPVLWSVELSLFPLKGGSESGGVFWGVCELSMTLSRLSAMGVAVFLSCWLFGVRCAALEPAGSHVGLGVGVDMNTSGSTYTS